MVESCFLEEWFVLLFVIMKVKRKKIDYLDFDDLDVDLILKVWIVVY